MVSKGGETQKQKPAFWAGSLNSGAGLGIDLLFYFYDL